MNEVEPTDAELIRAAAAFYKLDGSIDREVREKFGIGWARFFQMVCAVLDSPERIGALPPRLWPAVNRLDDLRLRGSQQKRALAS